MTQAALPEITPAVKSAIESGDVRGLERMLKAGVNPNMVETQEDESGVKSQHSALILAISLNQIEVAQLLVKAGAEIDTIFMNYDSVNKCMYELSALATTRLLYEFTLSNSLGALLSVLEEGIQKKQEKGQEPMKVPPVHLPKDVPHEVLVDSVCEGDLESVTLLLSHGMDVNLVHMDGESGYTMSLLILAIMRGSCSIATFLLDKGAECDTVYVNYNKEEDNIIELTALSVAESKQEKSPSREMDSVIHLIKLALDKTTGEPTYLPAKDIPKGRLESMARYRKKVPRIFIATVDEDEVEEIKAWDTASSVASFHAGRGQVYKETSDSSDQLIDMDSEAAKGNGHCSKAGSGGDSTDGGSDAARSTACVIL